MWCDMHALQFVGRNAYGAPAQMLEHHLALSTLPNVDVDLRAHAGIKIKFPSSLTTSTHTVL